MLIYLIVCDLLTNLSLKEGFERTFSYYIIRQITIFKYCNNYIVITKYFYLELLGRKIHPKKQRFSVQNMWTLFHW